MKLIARLLIKTKSLVSVLLFRNLGKNIIEKYKILLPIQQNNFKDLVVILRFSKKCLQEILDIYKLFTRKQVRYFRNLKIQS